MRLMLAVALSVLQGLLLLSAAPASAADTTRVLPREAVIARHADAASRFVELGGVSVHYKDEGSGPVLLLVHGTFGDLADWDGWADALRRHYRVVRLDLPGFGLTGGLASGNYSVDRMLGLIDSLMDQLGAERFAIAGVSYGGLVSFRYAATRTERVTALILANSAGIEYGARASSTAASGVVGSTASSTAASTAASSAVPRAPAYNILTDPNVTRADVETFMRFVLADPARVTPALVERKLDFANTANRDAESVLGRKLYERGDPERVLAHVRAPTLVLWGAANRALSTATADAFVAALKNACARQRAVYADAGHMLNLDQPQQSAADARAFLDRHVLAATREAGCGSAAATATAR